jgi:hypothetical protein
MHTYVLYDYVICVECVREYVWRVWGGTGAGLGFLAWAGTPLSHTRIIARAPWLVLVRWQIATKVDIKSSAAGVAGGTSLPPTFPLAPRPLTPTPYTRNPNPETHPASHTRQRRRSNCHGPCPSERYAASLERQPRRPAMRRRHWQPSSTTSSPTSPPSRGLSWRVFRRLV